MITPEEFWTRLKDAELLAPKRLVAMRKQISKRPSIAKSTIKIARVLVNNKVLTHNQARSLLDYEVDQDDDEALTQSEVQLHIETEPSVSERLETQKQHSSKLLKILGGSVVALLCVGIAVFAFMSTGDDANGNQANKQANENKPATSSTEEPQTTATPVVSETPYLLTDSTESLWARPNPGQPLSIKIIPPGTQMILRTRMSELLASSNGQNLLQSLGPNINRYLSDWSDKVKVKPNELTSLTLFFLPQGTTLPEILVEAELDTAASEKIPQNGSADSNGIRKFATDAIWIPKDRPNTFYFGRLSSIEAIASTATQRNPNRNLRRELRQLLAECHASDSITVLANPNFLRDEAQGMFPGSYERLLEGLFDFWRDECQAVALGYQELAPHAFLEVRMIAREDLRPRVLSTRVQQYVDELPAQASNFLGRAELDPYWQPVALRFPAMLSFLSQYTRVTNENDQVALNCVAPLEATHNLLLATELSLATKLRTNVGTTEDATPKVETLAEVLTTKTNVRFSQKSLDQAMKDVAQQIADEFQFEVEIRIVGSDLEPEGITRNQQIRNFAADGLTISEVLTQLVMKANPDQSVENPSDVNQKLIWVPAADRNNLILISTREAATTKQLDIPAAFLP